MEKSILTLIADNPSLLQAVREAVEKQFVEDAIRPEMSNEQIGQITRARIDGMKKIDLAFKEIARFRASPDDKPAANPAR